MEKTLLVNLTWGVQNQSDQNISIALVLRCYCPGDLPILGLPKEQSGRQGSAMATARGVF